MVYQVFNEKTNTSSAPDADETACSSSLGFIYVRPYNEKNPVQAYSEELLGWGFDTDRANARLALPGHVLVDIYMDRRKPTMQPDDVPTLFHEFGHAIHMLLHSGVDSSGVSSFVNLPMDVSEYPSCLYEQIAQRPDF